MIHTMKVGDQRSYKRIISKEDVQKFAELTGDFNEAHFNEEYCSRTMFKKPIVHGMLVGSLFSKVFGCEYPGEGTIYCSQSFKFIKPVYPDMELTVKITVKEIVIEKNRVFFTTEIFDDENNLLLTGEAMMMPRKDTTHE